MARFARTVRFLIAALSVLIATLSFAVAKSHHVMLPAEQGSSMIQLSPSGVDEQDIPTRRPPRLPRSKPEHWRS
jgi:hypothetical protein